MLMTTIRANRTIRRNTATHSRIVRRAETFCPFGSITVTARRTRALASMCTADMCGLSLAEPKILDAIVGSVAIDVMHDFIAGERTAKVRFHHKPMLEQHATLSVDDDVTERVDGSFTTAPCWRLFSVKQFLFCKLTGFRAARCVSQKLARTARDWFSAYKTWFGDLGHEVIVQQSQEV